ncbi:MAG TPA: serine/threonine-protein kinase [Anaerolineae bacterium]|nr:serine/threonine-protein kinase [Anaerolineae bacterium]
MNGRYRIARLLAQGGMGAVYRAWDLALNRPAALKEMLPDPTLSAYQLAELRQQFLREAQALASLIHPNLPRVTDFFEWNGNDYLVMDFIEGESLESLIEKQGALPEAQVLDWAMQLLDALVMCHERKILHRDIKPQNIIICPDGRAVLVDFGLVKLWDPRNPGTQRIIQGMGTQSYASPEHFKLRQREHTEPRSDLYSLGATLYHALTGQEPPSAAERFAGQPLPTSSIRARPHFSQAVIRSLSLDINARFSSAYEMKEALQPGTIQTPMRSQASTPPVSYPAQPARDTRWVKELGTAMVMAVSCAVTAQIIIVGTADYMVSHIIGMAVGALLAGAIGWFIGDTIFQALIPVPNTATMVMPAAGRPTTRLVMSTRKLMRSLTPAQQTGLFAALVIITILAAWILGPLVYKVGLIWRYFPSYAIAGPLAFAAMGRRPWRAFIAGILVIVLGSLVLTASVGFGPTFTQSLIAAVIASALMEGIGFFSNQYLLKSRN